MNRDSIKRTAICRYDARAREFIVESPLLDVCHGIADTENEAWEIFEDLLDAMYIEYLEGKGVGRYKRGRPSKGRLEFHAQIKQRTKKGIAALAKELNISQGEALDFLLFSYSCHLESDNTTPKLRTKRKAG